MMFAALGLSLLMISPMTAVQANDHGGIHIHLRCGEEEEVDSPLPNVCMEMKPWYHNQHFDEYEDIEDQSERLQDDTAWPGQREEFSDYLMR